MASKNQHLRQSYLKIRISSELDSLTLKELENLRKLINKFYGRVEIK